MKAKIKENELIYPSDFMFIESEGNWVSYPTEQMLINDGYKEIEYQYVDNLTISFEELNNKIVIYQQTYI